jgi:hypothetical protein
VFSNFTEVTHASNRSDFPAAVDLFIGLKSDLDVEEVLGYPY